MDHFEVKLCPQSWFKCFLLDPLFIEFDLKFWFRVLFFKIGEILEKSKKGHFARLLNKGFSRDYFHKKKPKKKANASQGTSNRDFPY